MAIPAKPTLNQLPPAPQRTDTPTDFADKADTFVAALDPYRQDLASAIDWQNTVFNATEIAGQNAEQSASEAAASETNAADSAQLASDWARKTGGTVDGSEYSAKHYAQEAQSAVASLPDGTINDATVSATDTWSSQKIDAGNMRRYDLASAATTDTLDLASSNVFRVDASVARTLSFANAPGADRAMTVVAHIAGNSAVTWPAGIDWDSDAAPELGDNETKVVLFWDGIEWSGFVRVAK